MKATLITLLITGCLLLIIKGSWGYVKGQRNLKRAMATGTPDYYPEDKEEIDTIKDAILTSSALLITGALGLFIIIYHNHKPSQKIFPGRRYKHN